VQKLKGVLMMIFLGISSSVFAVSYHICLASFSKFDNATNYVKELAFKGYSTIIEPAVVKDKLFYRILIAEDFETYTQANQKKSIYAIDFDKKDLWIFKADLSKKNIPSEIINEAKKEFEKSSLPKINKSINETISNAIYDESEIIIKPQLVKNENSINTFDSANENEDSNSNEYIENYETEIETETNESEIEEYENYTEEDSNNNLDDEVLNEIDVLPSTSAAVSTDYLNSLNKDEIESNFISKNKIPSTISKNVQILIKNFPINNEFKITELSFFDLQNINDTDIKVSINEIKKMNLPFEIKTDNEDIYALSCGTYIDYVTGKKVSILMLNGKDGFSSEIYKTNEIKENDKINLNIFENEYNCHIIKNVKNKECLIFGQNTDENIMLALSFEDDIEKVFLTSLSENETLISNQLIKKSILSLPDENAKIDRRFLKFNLSQSATPIENASERDDGFENFEHWNATAEFDQEDTVLKIGFYDID